MIARENQPPPLFRSDHDRVLQGLRYLLNVPSPAAGVDWTAVVPGGRSWRIHGGSALLSTSAAVANRLIGFGVTLAGVQAWGSVNTNAVAASGTGRLLLQPTYNPSMTTLSGAFRWVDIPNYWLPEGAVLGAFGSNIQAGDAWTGIGLLIEERWRSDADIELDNELEEVAEANALLAAQSPTLGG